MTDQTAARWDCNTCPFSTTDEDAARGHEFAAPPRGWLGDGRAHSLSLIVETRRTPEEVERARAGHARRLAELDEIERLEQIDPDHEVIVAIAPDGTAIRGDARTLEQIAADPDGPFTEEEDALVDEALGSPGSTLLRMRGEAFDGQTLRLERGEHEHYGYGMDPVICAECGTPID